MNLSKRMGMAIDKLYTAFHRDELNPFCCRLCAVGNICDNQDFWKQFTNFHGSDELNYVGMVNELFEKRFFGYTPHELLRIEQQFLLGCGIEIPLNNREKFQKRINKDQLFYGLEQVISFLCHLDGIKNLMDCSHWLNYEPAKSIHV